MRVLISKLYGIFPTLLIWATMAGFPTLAHAGSIESGHSAMWFDAARSGEGWVLEILHDDHALLYWYTYDEKGNQRWLQAVGDIVREEEGDAIEFSELYVTRGGRFGPEFNPDDVEIEIVGQASMRFTDCNQGEFSYSAFGQSQTIAIQRLSQTMAGGCAPPHGVTGQPVREYAGQSGSWFDPALSGQGFSMHWLSRDEALVTWYSYDVEGEQYWMLGVGHHEDGRIVFPEIHSTRGAKFGEAFNSDDVEHIEWGSLEMTLDCDTGTASFQSDLEEFGSGTFELGRLTLLKNPACPWIAPKLTDLYDLTWTEIPIPEDRELAAVRIANDGTIVANQLSDTPTGDPVYLAFWRPEQNRWVYIEDQPARSSFISADATKVLGSRRFGLRNIPMLWTEAGGWEDIEDMYFHSSYLRAVSSDFSRIVGVGLEASDANKHLPWLWDAEAGQRRLPYTPELPAGVPAGVSNDGMIIVGEGHDIRVHNDNGLGAWWPNGGKPEHLYSDQGERIGGALACNADCSVVIGHGWEGQRYEGQPDENRQGWYWMPSGQFEFFGEFTEDEPVVLYLPRAISADGNLVAGSYDFWRDPQYWDLYGRADLRSFLWSQNTGIAPLRSLIQEAGIGDDDWINQGYIDISPSGEKILLVGQRADEQNPEVFIRRAVVLELIPKE